MDKFTVLKGTAAPLPIMNVDTDMIIPKQFLKTIKRTGLGKNLFNDMRYDDAGNEKPDFVLNKPEFRGANILVAQDNFGCGSSREHAPWALLDFGIRCVIAPSYADIFYNNCFKNGILPVILPPDAVQDLLEQATAGHEITVSLQDGYVICQNKRYNFELDPFRRHCLLNGLDDIGLTLEHSTEIDSFEQGQKKSQPWLYTE